MTRNVLFAVLLVSVLAAAPSGSSSTHPVHAFFMNGIAAFNAHDLPRFMEQFADDVEMYTAAGWLRGGTAVRQRFADTFRQFPAVRMEIEELRVREVAPGTAVADFGWRVYPAGQGPAFHGVGTGVYVWRDHRWTEVLEHETLVKVDEGLAPGRK